MGILWKSSFHFLFTFPSHLKKVILYTDILTRKFVLWCFLLIVYDWKKKQFNFSSQSLSSIYNVIWTGIFYIQKYRVKKNTMEQIMQNLRCVCKVLFWNRIKIKALFVEEVLRCDFPNLRKATPSLPSIQTTIHVLEFRFKEDKVFLNLQKKCNLMFGCA